MPGQGTWMREQAGTRKAFKIESTFQWRRLYCHFLHSNMLATPNENDGIQDEDALLPGYLLHCIIPTTAPAAAVNEVCKSSERNFPAHGKYAATSSSTAIHLYAPRSVISNCAPASHSRRNKLPRQDGTRCINWILDWIITPLRYCDEDLCDHRPQFVIGRGTHSSYSIYRYRARIIMTSINDKDPSDWLLNGIQFVKSRSISITHLPICHLMVTLSGGLASHSQSASQPCSYVNFLHNSLLINDYL